MQNLSSSSFTEIAYPDSDSLPMAESDSARDYLIYAVEALEIYFQTNPQVYVSGNLFIYYEQGNPKAVVAPDVFVVLGVAKQKRRVYKLWEKNNKVPDFVLEVTSKSTVSEDQGIKKGLYAFLGVREYFQYYPTGDYLDPPLKGFRLTEDNYQPIPATTLPDGSLVIPSQTLGLELRVQDNQMRFYEPATGRKVFSGQEAEQARQDAEQARQEAEQARNEERERSQKLAAQLRELGLDPDNL